MRTLRLGELCELLGSAAFSAWWNEWRRASGAVEDARVRHEDLLAQSELMSVRSEIAQRAAVDAFSRSGDVEDVGTRWTAEAQGEENRALALVGEYEEQRGRTSDAWVHLGGAERKLEELRERADRPRARADHDAAVREAERLHGVHLDEYEAADRKRKRLWDEVEAAWATSFERALVGAEHGLLARRIRRDAERLFKEAEERRARARQLAAEADAARRELREAERRQEALRASAREQFHCVSGPGFLYWRHADDKRGAFAVALADGPDIGSVPLKALGVYVVGRQRGVELLEPARQGGPASTEERAPRLEDEIRARRGGGV